MLLNSISRNALLLGLFAVVAAVVIVGTLLQTKPLIIDNIRQAQAQALLAIVPDDRHDNDMLKDYIEVDNETLLGLREPENLYIARENGEIVAVIIPVTARDGYTGDIHLLVGVNRDGSVAGVRVLAHRETPGLGDKIDYKKSQWVDGFIGQSLYNPTIEQWNVKRDGGMFDQFTGATVTPRAVTRAVSRALQYFEQQYDVIFASDGRRQ